MPTKRTPQKNGQQTQSPQSSSAPMANATVRKQKLSDVIATRRIIRSRLTRKINEINELGKVQIASGVKEKAKEYLAVIAAIKSELDKVNKEVEEMYDPSLVDDSLENIIERRMDYDETAIKAICKLENMIASSNEMVEPCEAVTATPQAEPSKSVVIVKQEAAVNIPKFYGDMKMYRYWRQMFDIYAKKANVTNMERYHALRNSLGGRAAQEISHLDFVDDQYSVALDIITKKFGDDEGAEEAHIYEIKRICASDLRQSHKMNKAVSAISQNVRALNSLGRSFEALSLAIVPMIVEGLPYSLKTSFVRTYNDQKTKAEAKSKLECLIMFLEAETDVRRAVSNVDRTSYGNTHIKHADKQRAHANSKVDNNEFPASGSHAFMASSNKFSDACLFCKGSHVSAKCRKPMSVYQRKEIVSREGACFRCLRKAHFAKNCTALQPKCQICSRPHLAVLCPKDSLGTSELAGGKKPNKGTASGENKNTQAHMGAIENKQMEADHATLLQTGYVKARVGRKSIVCRVLLDTGSQKSYVTKHLVERLASKACGTQSIVRFTIGGQVSEVEDMPVHKIHLKSRFDSKESVTITCLEIPEITKGELPHVLDTKGIKPVADHIKESVSPNVEILIGSDFLPYVLNGEEKIKDSIVGLNSKFGWFFMGTEKSAGNHADVVPSLCAFQAMIPNKVSQICEVQDDEVKRGVDSLEDIRLLWESEWFGLGNPNDPKDLDIKEELKQFFRKTITRLEDGRYMVSLPFKENVLCLADNEKVARVRLRRLLANQNTNEQLIKAIDEEILKFVEKGIVEVARPRKENELAYYLPIQAVIRESSSSTKVRIVKDASSKAKGAASLNDVLHTGECLLPDGLKILLFFRKYKVVFVADIQQAFFQFKVNPANRTVLRFFWPVGISKNKNAKIAEMWSCVLEFGLNCSPYLHSMGVQHHLESELVKRPEAKEFIKEIMEHCYVDDITMGADSVDEAKTRSKLAVEIFASGCFPLKKWATNSKELGDHLKSIEDLTDAQIEVSNPAHKFLGVRWNQDLDSLGVSAEKAIQHMTKGVPTKRLLLKTLSEIFDPLGLVAPVVVNAKVLMQQLWVNNINWDTELTGEIRDSFLKLVDQFKEIESITINRLISSGESKKSELHLFADASLQAYGCVAYVRQIYGNGKTKVFFLLAKSRVTPTRQNFSIHRIELMAAVLAAKVGEKISKEYFDTFESIHFWSDSSTTLWWLRKEVQSLKMFVANRVRQIKAISSVEQWQYVASADNPSDLISRGTVPDTEGLQQFWLKGPRWLEPDGQPDYDSDPMKQKVIQTEIQQEVKVLTLATAVADQENPMVVDGSRHSSWIKAVRTAALVLRFVNLCRKRNVVISKHVTAEEFLSARKMLIRSIQKANFRQEVEGDCTDVHKASRIYQYRPFLDEDGIIRCRSRLEKSSELTYDEKYPIILPGNEVLVQLLIGWIHAVKCLHAGGIANTLHYVRSQYLVLKGRAATRKVLAQCKVCMKFKAKQSTEVVPPLPDFRVETSPPFCVSGVDYTGPVTVRNKDNTKSKNYILLFTCAVTRAIHLELTADLSTTEFLLAFRRFFNRRPTVQKLISDNAKTFKRAAKELELMFENVRSKEVQSTLANQGIEWQFITEHAPWAGGFYERKMKTIKAPLRRVLSTNIVSPVELQTLLTDVENIVNSSPISQVTTDSDEIRALCPADLMYGYQGKCKLPDTKRISKIASEASAEIFSKRWRRQQNVLNTFWKRYRQDYLQMLRSAHTAKPSKGGQLKIGDVCLLNDPSPSRAFWPLCRILSLAGGGSTDGRRRTCIIKTGTGQTLRRPIQSLYKLEV